MSVYYNENDPVAAAMLRQLIADGLIPKGYVDERGIECVTDLDLAGYTHCHFFAGIGGWAVALTLAGWPSDREVWTGSCPCQPFSSAGRQKGRSDERHLWPVWERLIAECRPATVFGEQVESAIAKGWLDDVYTGLEAQNYAVGSVVLPACSVGAPHRRNRLWFVGHTNEPRLQTQRAEQQAARFEQRRPTTGWEQFGFWHPCADGKERLLPIEPDVLPLADGVRPRRGVLYAAGNAIVPQVAAEFIIASERK